MHTQSLFDPICRTAESPQNAQFALRQETEIEVERRREKYGVREKERVMEDGERTHKTKRTDRAFLDCFISSLFSLHHLLSFSFSISSTSVLSFSLFQLPSALLLLSVSVAVCILITTSQVPLLFMSLIWNRFF